MEQDDPAYQGWTPRLVRLKEALVEPNVRTAIIFLMGVTLLLSCLTVLLFGLIPAVQGSTPDLHASLKEGARTGARRARMGRTIVVGQVALAMVLLVTTGELVQLVIIETRARLGFDPRQVLTVAKVAIVNQTFVKRLLADADPIGTFIRAYPGAASAADSRQIVGVVGDVIDRVGQNEDVPQVYAPFLQKPARSMMVVIRAGGDPATLAPAVRASVWAIDKDQPVGTIRTMKQVLDHKGGGDRLLGGLCGGFAALALGLAALGIHGMVSYVVAQRTHEARRWDSFSRCPSLASSGALIRIPGSVIQWFWWRPRRWSSWLLSWRATCRRDARQVLIP